MIPAIETAAPRAATVPFPRAAWTCPPARPSLVVGEVHVWRCPEVRHEGLLERMESWLGDGERRRARAFRFGKDRARFVASHARLREVLARYVVASPRDLDLGEGPDGKPRLEGSPLCFSLSHSGSLALVAVAHDVEVGVDVEDLRHGRDVPALATVALAPAERPILAHASSEAFLRHWTRKEAYLKGRGVGLTVAPAEFEVRPMDVSSDGRWHVPGDPAWEIRDLAPGPSFAAAIAVAWPGFRATLFEWSSSHGS